MIYYAYSTDYQHQGRYAMPIIIPLMYYIVKGIEKLTTLHFKQRALPRWLINTGVVFCFILIIGGTAEMIYCRALPEYLRIGMVL